jgi:hypothetical protein
MYSDYKFVDIWMVGAVARERQQRLLAEAARDSLADAARVRSVRTGVSALIASIRDAILSVI